MVPSPYICAMVRPARFLALLIVLTIAVKIFSLDAGRVERLYSTGIYPYIGLVQRSLLGWIPFSVGDFIYALAVLWLSRQLFLFVRVIRRKQTTRRYLAGVLLRFINGVLLVYVAFNLLWGLNYNRRGVAYQLQLDPFTYDTSDLRLVTSEVAAKLNELHQASLATRQPLRTKRTLFRGATAAYQQLSLQDPRFQYNVPAVKPSIYSYLGNYMGFTGYYNPFSGEAQVNTTVPLFVRPFTTCHEIGHQLGYAKESEANFAAYLSASSSTNAAFRYSVYFEMFAYASRYLYLTDSAALKQITQQLSPGVRDDIRALRAFLRRYDTPLETAIDRLYSQYLVANEQPSGRMSYNEVIGLLIAYRKKYGRV